MKRQLLRFKKKLVYALIISVFVTGILPTPISVTTYAKSKVVTSKLKSKSGIKNICKYSNMYVQVMAELGTKKKTISKMTENSKANLLCMAIAGMYNESFISSERLNEGLHRAIKVNPFKKQYKKLYGNYPNLNKINISNQVVKKNNGKIYVGLGDWGEGDYPVYKISKIVKTGSKKYTITVKNQKTDYDTGKRYTIGTTTIKIKASKNSSYGYIITGIKYQITSNMYY